MTDSNSGTVKKAPEVFQDQSSRLSPLRLAFTFSGLALGYFLSFLDQTSVATAIPSIAADLKAGETCHIANSGSETQHILGWRRVFDCQVNLSHM